MWRAQLHRRKPRAAQRQNSSAGGSCHMGTALLPETQPTGRGPLGSAPLSLHLGQGHGSASADFWPRCTGAAGLGESKAAVPPAGDKGMDGDTLPMGESTSPRWCLWRGLAWRLPSSLPAMAVLLLQSSKYRGVSYTKWCQQKLCCCSTFPFLMMWTGTALLFGISLGGFWCFPFLSTRVEWTDLPKKAGFLDLGVYIACSVRRLVNIKLGLWKGLSSIWSFVWDTMSLYQLLPHSPLLEASCSKYSLFEGSRFPIYFPHDFVLNIEYGLMAKRLSHLCKHVDVK